MNRDNIYISKFLPLMSSNTKVPSTIRIVFPYVIDDQEEAEKASIIGILENDITFSLRNKFGPILPDTSDLQTLFALAGSTQMPSWIGTSAQVWKGTDPISLSFDMTILNWSPDCNTEESLSKLAQLCSVSPMSNTMTEEPSKWRVRVHGNYKANILDSNQEFWTNNKEIVSTERNGKKVEEYGSKKLSETLAKEAVAQANPTKDGTITIQVGSKTKLSKLILTRCDITPSVVEVYSPSAGVKPRPLYYRVGLSMQTCRTALSTDIPGLFGLS